MSYKIIKPWIVLFMLCLMAAGGIGLAINAIGVFYPFVTKDLGVLSGEFALHGTIQLLAAAVTGLFIPRIIKKINFKLMILFAGILSSICTLLMGVSTSLWHFYVLAFIRGIAISLYGGVLLSFVINNWFYKFRGVALSIAFSFTGLAGAIASPLLTSLIETYGWQTTYFIKAIMMIVLVLPTVIYPYSLNPESEGLKAYGYVDEEKEVIIASKEFNYFNLYLIAFLFFGFVNSGITSFPQHFTNFAKSINLNPSLGANMLSYAMIGNIVFKLLIGFINDLVGSVKAVIFMISIYIAGAILIMFFKSYSIGAFLIGSSYSTATVGLSVLCNDYFKKENYIYAYPVASFAGAIGTASSLTLIGYSYDFTKTYNYAFMAVIILGIINIFLAIYLARKLLNK